MRAPLLLLFVAAALSTAFASAPKDTFRLANEAFEKGAIEDAIQLYQSIADRGYGSAKLFYNLGTAYAELSQWGEARYFLERASLENPRGEEIQSNLDMVKAQIDDQYTFPRYPFFGTVEWLHSHVGRHFLSLALLLLFGLLLWLVFRIWLGGRTALRPALWPASGLLLVVAFLFSMEITYQRFHQRMGILMLDKAALVAIPDLDGQLVTELASGHKLRIREELGPWLHVELADGQQGWIKAQGVRRLRIG